MKRILSVVIFIVFELWGWEEVISIDLGREKPVLVLNCILVEGDDTVRVAVSETRPTQDTTIWKTFYTESSLSDCFNIEQDMDEWGGCSTFYNTYIRMFMRCLLEMI